MQFCPTCGLVCVSRKEKDKTILVCRKCGYKIKDYKPIEIPEKVDENPLSDIVLMNEAKETLPKIKLICPKCSHAEAVWWMQQTKSADEPPTLFFRCTKCRHSWREE
jgi:DNA-directed RNA polymerase subunit M